MKTTLLKRRHIGDSIRIAFLRDHERRRGGRGPLGAARILRPDGGAGRGERGDDHVRRRQQPARAGELAALDGDDRSGVRRRWPHVRPGALPAVQHRPQLRGPAPL